MTCPRCKREMHSHSVSYFNTQDICFDCQQEERGAPNYRWAVTAENEAVRAKNFNFPGIGLAPEDEAYLEARRQQRATMEVTR